MDEITLTILGFGRDFKVAVYRNNKIHKVYTQPEFHNIPVYAGQKIEFIYKENRSWTYDDLNYSEAKASEILVVSISFKHWNFLLHRPRNLLSPQA